MQCQLALAMVNFLLSMKIQEFNLGYFKVISRSLKFFVYWAKSLYEILTCPGGGGPYPG